MSQLCSIDFCARPVTAKGLCNRHYRRLLAHGSPTGGGVSKGAVGRFLTEVVFTHTADECLQWPFASGNHGYPMAYWNGTMRPVHRLVCERLHGPPPDARSEAAHTCGNGRAGCVSPSHVSWKTRSANAADRIVHGTSNRGETNGRSSLTEEQVLEIRRLQGVMLQREIGAQFGVTQGTVSAIHRRALWGWL
jgi:hypothetical protein